MFSVTKNYLFPCSHTRTSMHVWVQYTEPAPICTGTWPESWLVTEISGWLLLHDVSRLSGLFLIFCYHCFVLVIGGYEPRGPPHVRALPDGMQWPRGGLFCCCRSVLNPVWWPALLLQVSLDPRVVACLAASGQSWTPFGGPLSCFRSVLILVWWPA